MTFEKGAPGKTEDLKQDEEKTWKQKKLAGMRVLFVEDNQVNRMIGSKFLHLWDIEIETAENGKVAVES